MNQKWHHFRCIFFWCPFLNRQKKGIVQSRSVYQHYVEFSWQSTQRFLGFTEGPIASGYQHFSFHLMICLTRIKSVEHYCSWCWRLFSSSSVFPSLHISMKPHSLHNHLLWIVSKSPCSQHFLPNVSCCT